MLLKLAFRNLFRNRGRTLITAASIFLAVILALMMRSLQFGVYENMIKNMVGFYSGYVQVQSADYWEEESIDNTLLYTPELEQKITNSFNVKASVPRFQSVALASNEEQTKGVLVLGIDPEKEQYVINVANKMTKGSYFSAEDEAVIVSSGLADKMKLEVGDTLVLLGQGYHGVNAAGKYPIKGKMRLGSPDLNGNMVFLPLAAAQQLYGAEDRLTSIVLALDKSRGITETTKTVAASLGEEYAVKDWKEMLPQLIQLIEADKLAGFIILGILYLIIGFGIFGTIVMMTNERIYEFGVLISIGMKRWRLMVTMILESLMVSFLGVLIGLILGFPILTYFYHNPIHLGDDLSEFSETYDMEPVLNFSLDPEIFWTQGLYVFIIALIVSVYPIYRISRLKVVEALRE